MGYWCLGHDLQDVAPSLMTGHYVETHLVSDVFTVNTADRGKSLATRLYPRCNICRSLRRWHDHHENARRRAADFRRQHASRWVRTGRAVDELTALLMMDVGGITDEAIAQLILDAIGEPCPGLCVYEQDGRLVVHTIESVADLHVDVRNPDEPLALENIGILCDSCNQSKGRQTWSRWIYKRRAALRAWEDALSRPEYRRPTQGSLWGTP